jgi:uncharacterized protein YlzI (FlbEa/FlbD family)
MIRVTRLDRQEFALNCDLIECIEAQPDTTIRLVTGQTRVVRESLDEVLERMREWRASVLERAGLPGLLARAPILFGAARTTGAAGPTASARELMSVPERDDDHAMLEIPT